MLKTRPRETHTSHRFPPPSTQSISLGNIQSHGAISNNSHARPSNNNTTRTFATLRSTSSLTRVESNHTHVTSSHSRMSRSTTPSIHLRRHHSLTQLSSNRSGSSSYTSLRLMNTLPLGQKQSKTVGNFLTSSTMSFSSSATTDGPLPELYQRAVIINPPKDQEHKHTVFFLHGLGDEGQSFVDVFQMLNLPNTRIILPNANRIPITCNGGYVMPGWYDIYTLGAGRSPDDRQDEDGIEKSAQSIMKAVDYEVNKLGGDASKVLLGGFSQGSAMSIHVGYRYPQQLGGIVAASGYALMAYHKEKYIHENSKDTPILLYHGIDDEVVPITLARKTRDYLQDMGIKNITYKEESGLGHSLSMNEIRAFAEFYKAHLQ